MPTYIATYVNGRGRTIRDRVDAIDSSMVEDLVRQRSGFLINIKEHNQSRYRNHKLKVNRKGLLMALEAVALLLEAGAKIDVAMRASVSRVPAGKLRYMMAFIARRIEESGEVSDAFSQFPRVFPDEVRNLLKAHETAGTLVQGLTDTCDYYRRMEEIRGDLAKGLFIPVLGLVAGLLSFAVIFGYTLPRFKKFIVDMVPVSDLPMLSRIFFGISDFVTAHPVFVMILPAVLLFSAWKLCQIPKVQITIFKVASRTPIIAPALMATALARFCTTYATLTKVGFKTIDTLEMSSKVCGNALVGDAIMRVREHVINNDQIGQAFQREKAFPNEFITAVSLGENNLEAIFTKLSVHYAREAKNRINIAISALEPAMMVLLGVFAALAGMSVMLPIVGLIGKLAGGK